MKLRPLQDRIIVKRVDQEKPPLPESSFLITRQKNLIKAKSSPLAMAKFWKMAKFCHST